MSGTLYYQPRTAAEKVIYSSHPSVIRDAFEEIFGGLPCILRDNEAPILNALAVLSRKEGWSNKNNGEPWRRLCEAVEKYHEIEVRMEY